MPTNPQGGGPKSCPSTAQCFWSNLPAQCVVTGFGTKHSEVSSSPVNPVAPSLKTSCVGREQSVSSSKCLHLFIISGIVLHTVVSLNQRGDGFSCLLQPDSEITLQAAKCMLASPRGRFREACGSAGGILAVLVKQGELLLSPLLLSAPPFSARFGITRILNHNNKQRWRHSSGIPQGSAHLIIDVRCKHVKSERFLDVNAPVFIDAQDFKGSCGSWYF